MKVADLTRPEMRTVAVGLSERLQTRAQQGPLEAALDAFIPELDGLATSLDEHVTGKTLEDTKRRAALVKLAEDDDEVDTWARQHHAFLGIAAGRRTGPNVAAAKAVLDAAFPDGLAHIDDYIPDENKLCRDALLVLRAPESATTLAAIKLPPSWQAEWETALDNSDGSFKAVQGAREARGTHVDAGRDTEADFIDAVVRLKRYIGSRASRKDKPKIAEGEALLEPLMSVLAKGEKERAARQTRKKNEAAKAGQGATGPTGAAATGTDDAGAAGATGATGAGG